MFVKTYQTVTGTVRMTCISDEVQENPHLNI